MKKILLAVNSLFFTAIVLILPSVVSAQSGLVPCGQTTPCTIGDFFTMLNKIYKFIVIDIAGPLAIVALTVGGIMMMVSAGNANLMSIGKKTVYSAIIGLALAFCSYAIISFVAKAVGYSI